MPEGLAGERVDAAMARMFGLSRTRAAELIGRGPRAASTAPTSARATGCCPARCSTSTIPALTDPLEVVPEIVEGIKIIHDDDSIVVIDKPVGVAVHPSPGWSGPTVVGHLAGAGFRIATSGASERQGIVQRLDVGTSGVMVICKSEHAYSRAQERLPAPRRSTRPTTRSSRATPTRSRAPSTPRSAGTPRPTTSSR